MLPSINKYAWLGFTGKLNQQSDKRISLLRFSFPKTECIYILFKLLLYRYYFSACVPSFDQRFVAYVCIIFVKTRLFMVQVVSIVTFFFLAEESEISPKTIAAIVVPIAVCLVFFIVGLCFLYKRVKRKHNIVTLKNGNTNHFNTKKKNSCCRYFLL